MQYLMDCFGSTPIANLSKNAVSLEYRYLLEISRFNQANISISSRTEA